MTLAIVSTVLTGLTFMVIVAIWVLIDLVKKGYVIIKINTEKRADILMNELDEIIMEGKNERK
jgi:hypothetical protein